MNYYEKQDKYEARGIDPDLGSCLQYNPQTFNLDDIDQVLAVVPGENDQRDWHWVLRLKDGGVLQLTGGCDYTGWDCSSWVTVTAATDPRDACMKVLIPVKKYPGIKYTVMQIIAQSRIYADLYVQVVTGDKRETWREVMDWEFGKPS